MKYSDIPQMTRRGSYEVEQPLNHFLEVYYRWLEQGLILEPDFQRGHVWNYKQQIKFVEFLLKGGGTNNVIYMNHPNWMGNFKGEWVVVDGLQRLTAVIRFLKGEIKVFGKYTVNDFEGRIPWNVSLRININNLKTRNEVLRWYLEMNEGATPHTKNELEKVKNLLESEKVKP